METGWFDTTITIDTTTLPIRVKRLSVSEALAFERDWYRLRRIQNRDTLALRRWKRRLDEIEPSTEPPVEWTDPPVDTTERAAYVRQVQARAAWRAQRDSDAVALRDLEETVEERTQRERLEAEDDAFATRMLTTTVAAYIRPTGGDLLLDERPVETGADLIAKYAAQPNTLYRFVAIVRVENALDDDTKKKLRPASPSPSASASFSTLPNPPVNGDAPETTVPAASTSVPASAEAVTA